MGTLHYGIKDSRLEGIKSPTLIEDYAQVISKISSLPMGMEGVFLLFSHEFICLSLSGNKAIKALLETQNHLIGNYWPPEILGLQEVFHFRLSCKQSLSVMSVPITDSRRGVLGYVTYIHTDPTALKNADVTLTMMADYLLEMSHHRHQQQKETLNCQYIDFRKACFLMVDNDGVIIHASQAFFEQFNIQQSDVINVNLFDLFLFPPKIKYLITEGTSIDGENVDFDFIGQLQQYKLHMNVIDRQHRMLDFSPIEMMVSAQDKSHRLAFTLDRYITESPDMQRVIAAAKESIKNTSPIYIMGEEGTGKRSLALTIHDSCERYSEGPFIAVNLHSVKKEDLSTLLLGSDEGEGTKSKFEMANGGTLYIERIDLLPGVLQAALTHIILTKTLFDINTNESVNLNFRLITSSIKRLEDLVHERRFCPSLYYYLTGASLVLPNLQNRLEDIPLIVERKLTELYGRREAIDESLYSLLLEHARQRVWAGNISELSKWIEHTFLHRDSVLLDASSVEAMSIVATSIQPLDDIEKREIANALAVLNRQYAEVAKQLGISLSTLRRKIIKYSL